MAVRLQMKLGVVAEADRLPGSPDRIVVVEPSVGSIARTKGALYLLVTSIASGGRNREATRLVAETIRDQYYYDESAGIRVLLVKAIGAANKRLAHQRDRFGVPVDEAGNGPIGVGVAVVRGNELYVATVGPAEAYLIRQARLSTLPDPHRERGLPTEELEPDVWRGEISVGDSIVLVSPNVMARLGPDEMKDAMLTLHPQSAMEHLHHRFVAADGAGSDGALAFEATEVAATHRQRTLVPVRPSEPLAGAPDRSPIPLADSVSGGVAAVQAGARQARSAAGSLVNKITWRIQDLLPRRGTRYRKVTPLASRRESQRRAAVALLAFVAVVGALGVGVYLGAGAQPKEAISSVTAGQRALEEAKSALAQVFGVGIDLVADDRPKAEQLLTLAYRQLDLAAQAGIPARTIAPLREQVVEGLDRLYGVVPVADRLAFTFEAEGVTFDLASLVRGPDGVPYVLDRASKSVYRVDLKAKKATAILREGQAAAGSKAAEPRFMTVGGPDLLILDAKNVLWRWRPADKKGKGTLVRVKVNGSSGWGADVRMIGTFIRNPEQGLYNLYVVDPSERQVLRYAPASDGSGFPAAPSGYLATAQAVDQVTSIFIDGHLFLVDGGVVERFVSGRAGDWEAAPPGDTLLRAPPRYAYVASASPSGEGVLYAFDRANARLVALDKGTGEYREQYRLAGGDPDWQDLRAMYVVPGPEGEPDTLWWIDAARLGQVALAVVPDVATPSPSPSPTPAAATSPSAAGSSPEPSAAP